MDEYNSYGWTNFHEACYKGYINAVVRLLDYAKETQKSIIEQRTIDDYKTTPLIISILGGHLDVVELLIKNGADVNAKLEYKGIKHGIVEIATIREDINLIVYMYDKIGDIAKRIKDLMILEKLDFESRACVGRTVQLLSQNYHCVCNKLNPANNSKGKPTAVPNSSANSQLSQYQQQNNCLIHHRLNTYLNKEQLITFQMFSSVDFGERLARFIKLSEDNEDSVSNAAMILTNLAGDDQFRANFCANKGVHYIVGLVDKHRLEMCKIIEMVEKKVRMSTQTLGEDEAIDEALVEIELDKLIPEQETNVICTSLGHMLCVLSKNEDSLKFINKEGLNENILNYIKTLFDYNDCKKMVNSHKSQPSETDATTNNDESTIPFEQYIGGYLTCLANLTHESHFNKHLFFNLNLVEPILRLWKWLCAHGGINTSSTTTSNRYNLMPISTAGTAQISAINFMAKKASIIRSTNVSEKAIHLSPILVKNLKLTLIECLGKVMYNNDELKAKYIYSYDVTKITSTVELTHDPATADVFPATTESIQQSLNQFIKLLTTLVNDNDRDFQIQVLKFIQIICVDDLKMQERIVSSKGITTSSLINNFRVLFRKQCPINILTLALNCIWTLTGNENYYENYDRKYLVYRAVGSQKYVDVLFESDDELTLRCIEAIQILASSPLYRDAETNELVNPQDEVAKIHAIPAIVRLLKSTNPRILSYTFKTISYLCVNSSYMNNVKNQSSIEKLATISLVIDICNKSSFSDKLKSEAYYSLSMICLNNPKNRKSLSKQLNGRLDNLIRNLFRLMTLRSLDHDEDHDVGDLNSQLDLISTQTRAGLTLCAFCYKNREFMEKILNTMGRMNWQPLKRLLLKLDKMLDEAIKTKDRKNYFLLQKLRCFYGYQLCVFYYLIDVEDEDPRVIGIKIIMDSIPKTKNTLLRSIGCCYVGKLISFNQDFVGSFVAINAVEILAQSMLIMKETNDPDYQRPCESERCNAALTLGFLTNYSIEARRRFLKLSRRYPTLIDTLKYFNKVVHIDLVQQWNHYLTLKDALNDTEYILSNDLRSLKNLKTSKNHRSTIEF